MEIWLRQGAQYVIQISDKQLWKKITATDTHCLTDLLPKKRTYQSLHQRDLDYMLPRFKSCFLNSLFLTLSSLMFVKKVILFR